MCVCISEGIFLLRKADFFFSLCCGIKEEALDVPAILEVIFHPWIAWYGWQWVSVHNYSLGKSQPSNFLWHINPSWRSISVCAGAQHLQNQLLCVHQGALETTGPLELLQHSQDWYFVAEDLCAHEAVSESKHPVLQSIISIFSNVRAMCLEFIIQGEHMKTRFCQRLFPIKLLMSLNSAEIV